MSGFGRMVHPQGVSLPPMRFPSSTPPPLLLLLLPVLASTAAPAADTHRTASAPPEDSETVLSGFGEGGIQLPYEAEFVGSKRCADCHTTEAGLQPRSNMFLTGQLVTADNVDSWFSAAALELPVRWPEWEASEAPRPPHYRRDGDEVRLEGPTRDGGLARAPVHAVFGSGRHAITPVTLEPGRRSRELRVTWSYVFDSWIMTPGSTQHPDPVGYVRPPEETRICFDCHTTRVVWDEEVDPARSVFGVHCERCHGPGSAHVDAVTSGSDSLYILNPGRFPAAEQTEFCSQCHRRAGDIEPLTAMKREARLARHAGAGTMLSDCFRLSPPEETLSCLDCHDPHRNADPGRDDYNSSCLRCHADPESDHTSEPVDLSSDCVSCHMPVQENAFAGMDFTDHWIRVPDSPPPLASPEKQEYADYLEASYREAMARPGLGPERSCRFRMRLGELLFGMGRPDEGLVWIEEALSFGPLHRDRIVAGELFERAGRQEKAIPIFAEAIRLAPGNNRAYHHLARLHMRAGDLPAAREVFADWEDALPDDPLLARMRAELRRRARNDHGKAPGP